MEKETNLKLLFLVLAGGGAEHLFDEQTQRQTWAENFSEKHNVIWVRANEQLKFDSLTSTLYVPCNEGELLKKTYLASHWCHHNVEFDVLVRTNVSTYFNTTKLEEYLATTLFVSNHFGGHLQYTKFGSNKKGRRVYIAGTGIFMGREAMQTFISSKIEDYLDVPDDIAITDILVNEERLILRSIPRLSLFGHHIFIPTFYIRCKSSWNSELASLRMSNLHEYYTQPRRLYRIIVLANIFRIEVGAVRFNIRNCLQFSKRIRVLIIEALMNTKQRMTYAITSRMTK
jgi:hypothetical protein